MEFDSPDVEKEFPGLYASSDKSKKIKDESDYSDDHDKQSKKELLIGIRKEKRDKKDRGYAALEGESSPEQFDANLSKSKKSKAFKFSSSKCKDKREKSRDKEFSDRDVRNEEKSKEKEKPEKEKKKDKKSKEKKEKSKDKDKEKKDKKSKQGSVSEDLLELGDVQPVFGVSVSLATERSRCHDGVDLPLVIRDCIDFLQSNSLKNEQIYKVEPIKSRLMQLKRLYSNRETLETDELDISTACGLLKMFLRELPEPLLTTDLICRFEEVASQSEVTKQDDELRQLLDQLPKCNKTILSWIMLHFDGVLKNEKFNKMNAQSLATLLSPPLQMSHRLLVVLLCHCSSLFGDVELTKYVAPLSSSALKIPEHAEDIQIELKKQESLLAQIHSEMNAGFASKKREEQLWEVQRIITQLKRKLRSCGKKTEKLSDDIQALPLSNLTKNTNKMVSKSELSCSDSEKTVTAELKQSRKSSPQNIIKPLEINKPNDSSLDVLKDQDNKKNPMNEGLYIDEEIGLLMLHNTHPERNNLIRLQLENQELLAWKEKLEARIGCLRADILGMNQLYQQKLINSDSSSTSNITATDETVINADYEKLIENYIRENALLDHKKNILAKEVFEERRELIQLQVQLAMQNF